MSKKLSNGLMGLRFMQNAQRAKQQAQVELEQAKVKIPSLEQLRSASTGVSAAAVTQRLSEVRLITAADIGVTSHPPYTCAKSSSCMWFHRPPAVLGCVTCP